MVYGIYRQAIKLTGHNNTLSNVRFSTQFHKYDIVQKISPPSTQR